MKFIETIQHFPEQFTYMSEIQNSKNLSSHDFFVFAGMGGSALAPDLLKLYKPELNFITHRDYGLPASITALSNNPLFIAISYSGNTEETLDAFETALQKNISVAAISTGGKLISRAKAEKVPYIHLPDIGIQPRLALGYITIAILSLLNEKSAISDLNIMADTLDIKDADKVGSELAKSLKGYFPIIYSSTRNAPLAYSWKSIFNETGKISAYANVFPEVNHNEIMGFDFAVKPNLLSQPFAAILLADDNDHPRVKLRMSITEELLNRRGVPVVVFSLNGRTVWDKIFYSLIAANFAAYYTAVNYGLDTENEETIEEFKRKIGQKKT